MSDDLDLVDVSDIFYFFFGRGRGMGESKAPGEGVPFFLLKIPGGVGVPRRREGEGECPGGCLRVNLGGGAKYFFRGRNSHQVDQQCIN